MLKPFDARVVVQKPQREEQTASGIILPDGVEDVGQTAIGEVVAVGPGSRNMTTGERMPLEIETGDKLIYLKMGAYEVKHNNKDYFVITEREIVAVVED